MGMDIFLEASVIGPRTDNSTISQYVYAAAISWAPIQNHKPVTSLSADMRVEHNAAAAAEVESVLRAVISPAAVEGRDVFMSSGGTLKLVVSQ